MSALDWMEYGCIIAACTTGAWLIGWVLDEIERR
jgi:hypothetical protein